MSSFSLNENTEQLRVAVVTPALKSEGTLFTFKVAATDSRNYQSQVVQVTVRVIGRNFAPRFMALLVGGGPLRPVFEGTAGTVAAPQPIGVLQIVDPDNNYPLAAKIQ